MHRRVARRDAAKDALDVPPVRHVRHRHRRRVRERREHLRVRPGLELGRAELEREKVRGRPAEPQTPGEDEVAAELLPGRRQLHALVASGSGEDVPVQVILHHLGGEAKQLVQLLHLVLVAQIHEL